MSGPKQVAGFDVGAVIRIQKGDRAFEGVLRADGHLAEMPGIALGYRISTGWKATVVREAPIPDPEPGIYVWRSQVGAEGYIKPGARVLKYNHGEWLDGEGRGRAHDAAGFWKRGDLVRVQMVASTSDEEAVPF